MAERERQLGFALIAALLAVLLLTTVGVLVFTVTTQDVRISSRMVGEKSAFFATESGIQNLTQTFDPLNDSSKYNIYQLVDRNNTVSGYRVAAPTIPTKGPAAFPMPGYMVGGGQQWGAARYLASVTGENTNYRTTVTVDAGIGFGPVEISTTYR